MSLVLRIPRQWPPVVENVARTAVLQHAACRSTWDEPAEVPPPPVTPQVITPTIYPPTGLYYDDQTVYMSTLTEDAEIYYTLDGSAPGPFPPDSPNSVLTKIID